MQWGDNAPDIVIEGVAQALSENKSIEKIVLVGDTERVNKLLPEHNLKDHPKLELHHASQSLRCMSLLLWPSVVKKILP